MKCINKICNIKVLKLSNDIKSAEKKFCKVLIDNRKRIIFSIEIIETYRNEFHICNSRLNTQL